MQITFTATSARELHDQIISFSKEFGISESRQAALPGTAAPSASVPVFSIAPAAAAPEAEGKRTRRTKAQIEADEAAAKGVPPVNPQPHNPATDFTNPIAAPAPPAAAAPAAPQAAAAGVTPTIVATPQQKQAVTEALTSVNGKFGLPVARGLLLKFGTDRLSSLDAGKYGEFLTLCERVKQCPTAADAQQLLA